MKNKVCVAFLTLCLLSAGTCFADAWLAGSIKEWRKTLAPGVQSSFALNALSEKSIRLVLSVVREGDGEIKLRYMVGGKSVSQNISPPPGIDRATFVTAFMPPNEISITYDGPAMVRITHVLRREEETRRYSYYDPKKGFRAKGNFDDVKDLVSQDQRFTEIAESMVSLQIEDYDKDDFEVRACSGFFATATLIITNSHCVSSKADKVRGWSRLLDSSEREGPPDIQYLTIEYFSDADKDPDFAILRSVDPSEHYIPLSTEACDDGTAELPQFPEGRSLVVNRDQDCNVIDLGRSIGGVERIKHGCDSGPGSSGSPLLRRGSLCVIGLHYWGYPGHQWNLGNRAENIDVILEFLQENGKEELAKELIYE